MHLDRTQDTKQSKVGIVHDWQLYALGESLQASMSGAVKDDSVLVRVQSAAVAIEDAAVWQGIGDKTTVGDAVFRVVKIGPTYVSSSHECGPRGSFVGVGRSGTVRTCRKQYRTSR